MSELKFPRMMEVRNDGDEKWVERYVLNIVDGKARTAGIGVDNMGYGPQYWDQWREIKPFPRKVRVCIGSRWEVATAYACKSEFVLVSRRGNAWWADTWRELPATRTMTQSECLHWAADHLEGYEVRAWGQGPLPPFRLDYKVPKRCQWRKKGESEWNNFEVEEE